MSSASATFSLAVLLSATNRTGGAFGSVEKSAQRLNGMFDRTSKAAQELFTAGNTMGVGFAGWFLKQGMEAEDIAMNFRTLLKGNKEAADALIAQTKSTFSATKIGSDAALENGQSLLAFGVKAEKVVPIMKQLGDLALGNKNKFNSLVDNYGKMVSAQNVSIIDLRQFSLAGAPVIETLQEMTGKTGAEFDELVTNHKVTVAMVEEAFARMTSGAGRFNNAMANAGTTASGKMSVALASLSSSATGLSLSLMPVLTDIINMTIPAASALGSFIESNQTLSKAVIGTTLSIIGLKAAISGFSLIKAFATDIYSYAVKPFYDLYRITKLLMAAEAAGNMRAWYATMEKGGIAATAIGKALQFAKAQQLGFNAATLLNPYVLAATTLAALTAGVGYYIYKKHQENAAERANIDLMKQAAEMAVDKKANLMQLIDSMKQMQQGSDKWKEAIRNLRMEYGQYLRGIDLEKATLGDLPGLYEKAAKGIDDWAKAQALASVRRDYYTQIAKNESDATVMALEPETMMEKAARWAVKGGHLWAMDFTKAGKMAEKLNENTSLEKRISVLNDIEQKRKEKSDNRETINTNITVEIDGKKVADAVAKTNRTNNRGSFDQT